MFYSIQKIHLGDKLKKDLHQSQTMNILFFLSHTILMLLIKAISQLLNLRIHFGLIKSNNLK